MSGFVLRYQERQPRRLACSPAQLRGEKLRRHAAPRGLHDRGHGEGRVVSGFVLRYQERQPRHIACSPAQLRGEN